ncbi:HemK family protein methyltransferase [Candidatus Kaiserbacteria bacterium]|nr:HemK family protein methyltransferase [Candidatus Kaiserbacteria bacterium]
MQTDTEQKERAWLLREKYGGVETPAFFDDCKRLFEREPLAYLIGHIPFLNTAIFLDSRPLIPRPETEYWTELAIAEIKKRNGRVSVLDLCAGSGCIGVAVAHAVPEARVDFAEIDARHHPTIEKNIRENGIDPSRIRIFGGDLFSEIPQGSQYDFILTNPPYLDPILVDRIDASVMEYEPAQAILGGTDGMTYISRILENALGYLAPGGMLYIEHEPEQAEYINTHPCIATYASCETFPDQWNVNRYSVLTRS